MNFKNTGVSLGLGLALGLVPAIAAADDFAAGSLIVPMDTTYQDKGMFEAYGLVYELLKKGVPVRWVIKIGKKNGDTDFMATSSDVRTGMMLQPHGYRGGPWVIDSADAAKAMPVIEAWQQKYVNTTVHEATTAFSGDVSRTLIVAPSIAMMADGNQKIARKYMMAAKIPDSTGDPLWPDASPDMLDPMELSGPSTMNHKDGKLFDEDGDPVYCQFMSMHWAVKDAQANPEVVAEMREFLQYPTHLFAECQAVNAFENLVPHGFFLTAKGFLIGTAPNMYDYFQGDSPFAQIDGPFQSVGGSEPAYTLPPGEMYKAGDTVLITQAGTPIGVNDVWMAGYIDGICPGLKDNPDISALCLTAGKVSYLGGHEYDAVTPMSANPKSQGTRLFLNSLFEAPCATAEGLPQIVLTKKAPAVVDTPMVTYDIDYVNEGPMTALDATITDTLPPGTTFVSATNNGAEAGGVVTWNVGNVGEAEAGTVSVTVMLGGPGVYTNGASISFKTGVNTLSVDAPPVMTQYGEVDTGGGTAGTGGTGGTGGSASGSGGVTDSAGTGGSASASASASGTGDSNGGSGEASVTGSSASASGGTEATGGGSASATGGASEATGDSASGTGGMTDTGSCGCRSEPSGGWGLLLGLAGLGLRRRRRAA